MTQTIVKVDGMMCSMCESHINEAVRRAMEVKKVTSSHTKGVTEIITDQPVDEQKVRDAIEATGYRVMGVSSKPYEKKGFFSFLKK